jgi:hypothetical protein
MLGIRQAVFLSLLFDRLSRSEGRIRGPQQLISIADSAPDQIFSFVEVGLEDLDFNNYGDFLESFLNRDASKTAHSVHRRTLNGKSKKGQQSPKNNSNAGFVDEDIIEDFEDVLGDFLDAGLPLGEVVQKSKSKKHKSKKTAESKRDKSKKKGTSKKDKSPKKDKGSKEKSEKKKSNSKTSQDEVLPETAIPSGKCILIAGMTVFLDL